MHKFEKSPEPKGNIAKGKKMRFVVQEHHASRLHFDFRLEIGGVLKSWSVPKGPSLDPVVKRLAIETEDHPVSYLYFEGRIPEGSYGAGEHMMWDIGTFELLDENANALKQYEAGRINFRLYGKKLYGAFSLVHMKGRGDRQWLLIKMRDEYAESGWQLQLRLDSDEKARVWRKMMEGKASKK
jgi:bifunctional non-homologous end joining protein LigD